MPKPTSVARRMRRVNVWGPQHRSGDARGCYLEAQQCGLLNMLNYFNTIFYCFSPLSLSLEAQSLAQTKVRSIAEMCLLARQL